MSQYRSLQDQLQQIMTTSRPAKPPPPPNSASVFWHVSRDLPPEATERLRCARCKGTGVLGGSPRGGADDPEWPCPVCAGAGVVCPTCRDTRWLRTTEPGQAGHRPIKPCPDCATPEQRLAAIDRYVAEVQAAQAAGRP